MSSEMTWAFRLEHILQAIGKIQRYTVGHTGESLRTDDKTLDAVVRNFQVIGEAARHIPESIQQAHPEVPWSDMQKMRHVLVHNYDRIDPAIVWQTVQNDLPPLIEPLQKLLAVTKS